MPCTRAISLGLVTHTALLPRPLFHGGLFNILIRTLLIVCAGLEALPTFSEEGQLCLEDSSFSPSVPHCVALRIIWSMSLNWGICETNANRNTACSTMLAGRAFQGVGSGVILSLVEIVVSDLVPLSDRSVIF